MVLQRRKNVNALSGHFMHCKYVHTIPTFHCNLTVQFTFNCLIQSNVEVTVKKTVNQLYNYLTVLGATKLGLEL